MYERFSVRIFQKTFPDPPQTSHTSRFNALNHEQTYLFSLYSHHTTTHGTPGACLEGQGSAMESLLRSHAWTTNAGVSIHSNCLHRFFMGKSQFYNVLMKYEKNNDVFCNAVWWTLQAVLYSGCLVPTCSI